MAPNSPLEIDQLVDRRRLRRRLAFWRSLAAVLLVAALAGIGMWWAGDGFLPRSTPHVARITVGGLIRTDRDRLELLDDIAKSGAEAVIVSIDSPGGTVAGSEALYDGLRRLNEKKPVVAVVTGMAASGAYITAMGAERIFAPRNALVGSIGVLFQYPNVSELMKTVGISYEEIKSSPLKASPNPFTPTSPEARAAVESLVADSYDWFRGLVAARREISGETLASAADGRVFTAHQAMPLKLVDEIGDERAARAWLAKEKNVSEDLPVRDWHTRRSTDEIGWLRGAVASFLSASGLSGLSHLLAGAAGGVMDARLDGLLALWHPRGDG